MTERPAESAARRARRKSDLLLASALMRHEAAAAFVQISDRADGVWLAYQRIRVWMSVPTRGGVGRLVLSAAVLLALRNVRVLRLMRWGLVGWRLSTSVLGLLSRRRHLP